MEATLQSLRGRRHPWGGEGMKTFVDCTPSRILLLSILALASLCAGCGKDPQGVTGGFFPARGRLVFVVNGLSETLSAVSLEDYVVFNGIVELGRWPNGLAWNGERNALFVVNSGDNNVMEIDLETGEVRRRIDVGIGRNPWECAWDGHILWVSAFLTGELVAVEPESGTVTHYPVGTTLQAVAATGGAVLVTDTQYQYGSFEPGKVLSCDPTSGAKTAEAYVGINPQDLLSDGSGRIHVVCSGPFASEDPLGEGEVHVLDALTLAPLDTLRLGGNPSSLALDNNGVIYAAGYWGGLMAYDASSLSVLHDATDPLIDGEGYMDIAFDEGTGKLLIADFDEDRILIVDPLAAGPPERLFGVGDGPTRFLIVEENSVTSHTERDAARGERGVAGSLLHGTGSPVQRSGRPGRSG